MSISSDQFETTRVAVIEIAKKAGHILVDGQANALSDVEQKSSIVDVVTAVDKAAEKFIVERLVQLFPDDGILGEEGAERPSKSGRRWIIDPLDGTANFIRGWKMSAVSIGLQDGNDFVLGVVYNPFVNEMFSAVKGHGARLNEDTLRIKDGTKALNASYVSTDGGFAKKSRRERSRYLAELIVEAGETRSIGSTALSLAHTAMGRCDAHVNIGSKIWDIAAGVVIAREAGVIVQGVKSGSEPTDDYTIAARPELIGTLQQIVSKALDPISLEL